MAQYDSIGGQFDLIKATAFAQLEQLNLRNGVEPYLQPHGTKTVLDLACGTGFYSKLLLDWGAKSVVGVDISQAMLDVAESRLEASPHGSQSKFVLADGTAPKKYTTVAGPEEEKFDIVTGVWFLNYAQNSEELQSMFETIKKNLKPDGVFVGICPYAANDLAKYAIGMNKSAWSNTGVQFRYSESASPNGLGHAVHMIITPPKNAPPGTEKLEFDTQHLRKSVVEEAAQHVGFQGGLEWLRCEFPGGDWRESIGLENDEPGWKSLQEYPILSVLVFRGDSLAC